ncbi:MgtC/SapB family protein [Candidatus Bipolaricaulota bacterium]
MAEWSFVWRILIAAGLSAVIGIEREFHGRPAGLRTHLLVGTGAALVMVALQVAWDMTVAGGVLPSGLPAEVGRLAAGIITGIGFLGAGTIIKVGDWVHGLTTAASLWFVAMLGISAGLGAWQVAVTGGAIGIVVLAIVDPLASAIPSRMYQMLRITMEADKQGDIQTQLMKDCFDRKTRATLVTWESTSSGKLVTLTYRVRQRGTPDLQHIAEQASLIDGVVETHINL